VQVLPRVSILLRPVLTGGKNCSLAKTARGSTDSYVAFIPDESFCFDGILTTSNNLLPKLALEPWLPSIP